jgi:hypothetical protein
MLQTPAASLGKWEFYLMLGCMLSSLFFQLSLLNKGLEHHNALLIVPLYQTFWMLTSIVG